MRRGEETRRRVLPGGELAPRTAAARIETDDANSETGRRAAPSSVRGFPLAESVDAPAMLTMPLWW